MGGKTKDDLNAEKLKAEKEQMLAEERRKMSVLDEYRPCHEDQIN